MKKFIKIFIVILSVLAVVGGTVYFFFTNLEKELSSTGSIVNMLQSESKQTYNDNLARINQLVNSDGKDDRIQLIVEANQNLDNIIYELSTYYAETRTTINNKTIAKKLDVVKSKRNHLNRMMEEYKIKQGSAFFDRHIGVNDFYAKGCSYLIDYAKLANLINKDISKVDKNADIKFSVFEIYSNIVINTFKETQNIEPIVKLENVKDGEKWITIQNSSNIKKIQEILPKISTTLTQFNENINKFNKYYSNCDKQQLAIEFALNVRDITVESTQNDNAENATYLLKLIFGI